MNNCSPVRVPDRGCAVKFFSSPSGEGSPSGSSRGYAPGMRIVSLHIGMPRPTLSKGGSELLTGGAKLQADKAMLRFESFEGDGVADHAHHGGPDRAACVYPAGHYAWWKATHGLDLAFGSFSENLTVEGAREEEVCIGDTFRVGDALAMVTLPRDPCVTLDRLTGHPSLARLARESGRCGFHMRTIEEGVIREGDPFEPVQRHSGRITVAAVLDLYHGRSRDRALFDLLCGMPEFGEQGKREIARRLG